MYKHNQDLQSALNSVHRQRPVAGDVWDERFMIVGVVVRVSDTHVVLLKHRKQLPDGYTFDIAEYEVVTREQFAQWPLYGGNNQPADKCWCDVSTGSLNGKALAEAWADQYEAAYVDPAPVVATETPKAASFSEAEALKLATHRHYKGGLYRVVGEATHTETQERLVVYEHLYPHAQQLWTRPYDMFYGNLDSGEPRFKVLTKV